MTPTRRPLSADEYVEGVLSADRATLGRAITLVESTSPRHTDLAREVLTRLLPHAGGAHRVGITGVPGAGKSTFIECLGTQLTARGHRVAVLAVDPSSSVTGGSILGDKTRMAALSVDPCAFVRPSPSAGTLGGVARKTRETMVLCEAAGFDVLLVETVGVGQSETVVAGMTDFFLALMVPGTGDELQGIKRGLLELADLIAVNKADGDNVPRAEVAAQEYRAAVRYMQPRHPNWATKVVTCSARTGAGVEALWNDVAGRHESWHNTGYLQEIRSRQSLAWMWAMVEEQLRTELERHPGVAQLRLALESGVRSGTVPPAEAARRLLEAFRGPEP